MSEAFLRLCIHKKVRIECHAVVIFGAEENIVWLTARNMDDSASATYPI